MKPLVLALCGLFIQATSAFAQGAILEDPQTITTPPPQPFRGVLPDHVDLSPRMPPPRGQADTGTCVSWAVTYSAASLALRGKFPNLTLSPSFSYNQVSPDANCQNGTTPSKTLDLLKQVGALPIEEFAFDAGYCGRKPSADELQRAARYRIAGWSSFDARNLDMVKQQIGRGAAVIFGTRIGPRLRSLKADDILENDTPDGIGHLLVAVGYDDRKHALMFQNSWGRNWASGGYGWISYDYWSRAMRLAYVIN